MDSNPNNDRNERSENMLKLLTKCKLDYFNVIEENKKLRESNAKFEFDLNKARELEKSQLYQLQSAREMIGNLHELNSQLIYVRRDNQKLKDEIISKDIFIATMEKVKYENQLRHNEDIIQLKADYEKRIEELQEIISKKAQEAQHDLDSKLAGLNFVIEDLKEKINQSEDENKNKINMLVLEYEAKIQYKTTTVSQLQEHLKIQIAQNDANQVANQKKIEDLEEKLKQSQFREYLAQRNVSSPGQFENRVERPYSASTIYSNSSSSQFVQAIRNPIPHPTPKTQFQAYHHDENTPVPKTDKKGPFNLTKKRKLYTHKEFS